MSDTLVKEIVMKLRDIEQLFLAPDRDHFLGSGSGNVRGIRV